MPQDDEWRTLASTLMNKLRESDAAGTHLSSKYVKEELKEEAWQVARRDNNPNEAVGGSVFSTNTGRGGRGHSQAPRKHFAPENSDRYKRARTNSYHPDHLSASGSGPQFCQNPFCEHPLGHTKDRCYAYGGGLVGKHLQNPRYRGPEDIPLHPAIRRKVRR